MPPGVSEPLRVTAVVDVGTFHSGMSEAADAVEQETARMNTSFSRVGPEWEEATHEIAFSTREARHALHGLGEEVGIHIPRFVQSFVSDLGGVGPALAAAFTPIAIVGVLQVLVEAGEKLYEFYENVVNLKSAFEAVEGIEKQFTQDQISLSNALLEGEVRMAKLVGGSLAEGPAKIAAFGAEIVDLGKMVDTSGKSFKDLAVGARASLREFLVPTQAKDLEDTLKRVGIEIERVKSLLLNTEEGTTEYEELASRVGLLSEFYGTLALRVQKYNQEVSIGNAETNKAQQEEAEKRAKKEEEAAARAQRAWHQAVIAELDDAERLAKETTKQLEEKARENAEFDRNIEEEIKKTDEEIVRFNQMALEESAQNQKKALAEEARLQKERERAAREATKQITEDLNKNIIAWMDGQETVGRAFQRIWTNIANTVVSALLKAGEQMLVNAILQKAIFDQTKIPAAQKAARDTYANVSSIPVVGPFLAPEAAAAAFAAVMAFEKGGIVPHDAPAFVHANEMVLPAHISKAVQGMASSGATGGAGHTFNFNHYGPGTDRDVRQASKQFMKEAMRELRRRGMATV